VVARRGKRSGGLRHAAPAIYLALGILAAVIALPSALRPPPDPANQSGALDPNAPPKNNPDQIIQSLRQAGGGGAGAGEGGSGETPTTVAPVASVNRCYGNPPRQIPSVYSGPCVGAWRGNNGGKTSKNVFPNEIRIVVTNAGKPDDGRQPEPSSNNASTSANTRTWQVLAQYFNEHYQLYGRRVVFYGLGGPSQDTDASYAATAKVASDEYQAFAFLTPYVGECQHFVREGLVAMCDPLSHKQYLDQRPGMFSIQMDIDQQLGLGAEFTCKSLVGRNVKFAGGGLNGQPRKIGFLGWDSIRGGAPVDHFTSQLKSECGATVEAKQLNGPNDVGGAAAAISRFRADGITTIVFATQGVNVLSGMSTATSIGYYPEWVSLGGYADDTNLIGTVFPKEQSAHLFGFVNVEWAQQKPLKECARAYHTIDPNNDADNGACGFWPMVVLTLNGLQGAGPNLTPASFEKGMFAANHRYGLTPYMMGGGFGLDDYSYVDDVALTWWNSGAVDPENGAPGAYMFTNGGRRFRRGQLPKGDDQFFVSGTAEAPEQW
jgi:hypothetical protein